ncbi:MAG TPA: hypothetical protein VMB80_02160 [Candidatus Acidoferrum sp.]|nr:hypothetical protein [Candidatus Acidoferrum sp.]
MSYSITNPHPALIRFARRHAYMMKEGFFDGVRRDAALVSGELFRLLAWRISELAGITLDQAQDALAERWEQMP